MASFDEFLKGNKSNDSSVGGVFECHHCDGVSNYAKFNPTTKKLTWECESCRKVSQIEEFPF